MISFGGVSAVYSFVPAKTVLEKNAVKHEFKALNPKYNQPVVGIQINAMKPQLNIQDKYMYKWQLNIKK